MRRNCGYRNVVADSIGGDGVIMQRVDRRMVLSRVRHLRQARGRGRQAHGKRDSGEGGGVGAHLLRPDGRQQPVAQLVPLSQIVLL